MILDYAYTSLNLHILLMTHTYCLEVTNWALLNLLNKLSLNADKTKLIFFRSKQHSLDYENISIKFNGIKLNPVEQVKYLGIYIDKYLSCITS